jgi:recombinational DNA repair ATPase RecF
LTVTLTPIFGVGYKNNIIKVQKADFDAFEALDMDSAAVAKAAAHKRQQQVTAIKSQVDPIDANFPGTDFIILKIFLPKNSAKQLAFFFTKNTASL